MITILKGCQRELEEFPEVIRGDLADALARLEAGLILSFPLSRSMPSIGKGVHELRLRGRDGIYRIIYALVSKRGIWLLHAFKKKTQKTPQQAIELAKRRLKEARL